MKNLIKILITTLAFYKKVLNDGKKSIHSANKNYIYLYNKYLSKLGVLQMKRMIVAVNLGLIALVIVGTLAMVSISSSNMSQHSDNLCHINALHNYHLNA
jgi:hypothetical protein